MPLTDAFVEQLLAAVVEGMQTHFNETSELICFCKKRYNYITEIIVRQRFEKTTSCVLGISRNSCVREETLIGDRRIWKFLSASTCVSHGKRETVLIDDSHNWKARLVRCDAAQLKLLWFFFMRLHVLVELQRLTIYK